MELKHIVLLDFVLNNTDHYRQDVVGLEDDDNLKIYCKVALNLSLKMKNLNSKCLIS